MSATLVSLVLGLILAGVFGALGTAKILAVESMRARAAHLGFGVTGYRLIGVLEVAGALGVLQGLRLHPLGVAAGLGLALLMVGAVISHLRVGDGPGEWALAGVVLLVAVGFVLATWAR